MGRQSPIILHMAESPFTPEPQPDPAPYECRRDASVRSRLKIEGESTVNLVHAKRPVHISRSCSDGTELYGVVKRARAMPGQLDGGGPPSRA